MPVKNKIILHLFQENPGNVLGKTSYMIPSDTIDLLLSLNDEEEFVVYCQPSVFIVNEKGEICDYNKFICLYILSGNLCNV